MADDLIRAFDISVYTGAVSAEQMAAAKAAGYELAVVGSWHGTQANKFAADQLENARTAGLRTATYVVLNGEQAGWQAVSMGLAACSAGDLDFVALDCELGVLTEQTFTDGLQAVINAHLQPVVYTAKWYWDGHLSNPDWAYVWPLWSAQYDGEATLDDVVLYGGWSKAVGKQYSDKAADLPFTADQNIFSRSWLEGLQDTQA